MTSSKIDGVKNIEQREQLNLEVGPLLKIYRTKYENGFSGDADKWIEKCCCLLVFEVTIQGPVSLQPSPVDQGHAVVEQKHECPERIESKDCSQSNVKRHFIHFRSNGEGNHDVQEGHTDSSDGAAPEPSLPKLLHRLLGSHLVPAFLDSACNEDDQYDEEEQGQHKEDVLHVAPEVESSEPSVLVVLFCDAFRYVLWDAKDASKAADEGMCVKQSELGDVPHGFQEDFDVWRQVDSDDWHVTKDLDHGQEGPEVHHFAVQPEGNVQLDDYQHQEYDSLAMSRCFQRCFINILWQLPLQNTHKMCPLFTSLFHDFASFCNKDFRLLDLNLGLVQLILGYGYWIIELKLDLNVIGSPANDSVVEVVPFSSLVADRNCEDIVFAGQDSLWFLEESCWDLELLIEADLYQATP